MLTNIDSIKTMIERCLLEVFSIYDIVNIQLNLP